MTGLREPAGVPRHRPSAQRAVDPPPSRSHGGLPRGSRDLLPPSCRRRRELVSELLGTFERWGYAQVMTPMVEYYDVLGRGLGEAERRLCVRFIEAGTGEVVALRADATPQIARIVAERVEPDPDVVLRLCYAVDVVRQPTGEREQTEYHQVGVELVGDGEAAADAELVALCGEALERVGLVDYRVDLAHVAVARTVVDAVGLDPDGRDALCKLLARKDRGGVGELLASVGTTARVRATVVGLCDLFGAPDVLSRARKVIDGTEGIAALDELERLLASLHEHAPTVAERVTLDLGEVRGFDYYTGMRVRVWAPGVGRPLVRGGRYDDLLARYGAGASASGFAVDLDAVEAALAHAGRTVGGDGRGGTLIAIDPASSGGEARAMATATASRERAEGRRAWVQPSLATARAYALADDEGADAIVMIERQGEVLAAVRYRRGEQGWAAALEGGE